MNKSAAFAFLFAVSAWGQATHRFNPQGALTEADDRAPRDIGMSFLQSEASGLKVDGPGAAGTFLAKEYRTAHNGVTHLVFRQQFRGIEVLNAEWTINIDESGQVLNSGGLLFNAPGSDVGLPGPGGVLEAAAAAARAVNPALGAGFRALTTMQLPSHPNAVRMTSTVPGEDLEGELIWYGMRGIVRPAWLIYVVDGDESSTYNVVIDAASGETLAKQSMTMFQQGPRGQVFERESPQPNPKPGVLPTAAPPVVERTVQSFAGDPKASPSGWVSGTATSGNNTTVGENLLGLSFSTNPDTTSAPGGNFSFPLQLGVGLNPLTFKDAANTNLFYWINRVHDLSYQYGFDEASGNFQANNFGKGGSGGDSVLAYTHYGAANVGARGQIANAFFSWRSTRDGSQPMLAMFISRPSPRVAPPASGLITDGALDATVIIHEYTHGVSSRLASQVYTTFQGASMGEAWSDFFGVEYTVAAGAPPEGTYTRGEYYQQSFTVGDGRSRPISTNLEVNPLTYAHLGNVISFPEVHADGEIWVEALWEARANLIRQFGDAEGRRRIRLLVMDGMKLGPPASSMIDMRDAILLADRVDFRGASQDQLWAAFAKRGMGATAYSAGGNTIHVVPSFDLPSNAGRLKLHEDSFVIGEPVRVILQDSNLTAATVTIQLTSSAGDVENLILARAGSTYQGTLPTSGNVVTTLNGTLNIIPDGTLDAFYVDLDAGGGSKLVKATAGVQNSYGAFTVTSINTPVSGEQRLPLSGTARIDLPFAFPFFEGKYKSAFVSEDGALFFDQVAGSVSGCTDTTAMAFSKMIAPLWSRLTTQGFAQANEGVFTRFTEGTRGAPSVFNIRWAGETLSQAFFSTGRGNPVNFSLALSSDGGITFGYGTGNTEIGQARIQAAGCNSAATVGISNGHDVFAQSYSLVSYANTAVRLDPPFNPPSYPNVTLDAPAEGAKVKGLLTVSGVAWDAATPVSRVDIFIDGVLHARATTGQPSADFCATRQTIPGCPRVGYVAQIDLAARGIGPGTHTLRVRATNSRGAWLDVSDQPSTFVVEAGQAREPFGKIESIVDGDTIGGTVVTVAGYAAANDLRVVLVDVLIDGISYGNATYGFSRTDICNTLRPAPLNCPAIGWRFNLNTLSGTIPLADGAHKMQIRIQDETGRLTTVPETPVNFTVSNKTPQPVGEMTSPKMNDVVSGTITVTGYAYVPGGRVTGGFVVVDGAVWDPVVYGAPAPEVCAGLPEIAACPNVGLSAKFDTTRLTNGPHILGVVVLTNVGGNLVLSPKQSSGVNVFVRN